MAVFRAIFQKGAGFSGATFRDVAWFDRATFQDSASFSEATFQDSARFERATFQKHAGFPGATFRSASFSEAIFEDSANFSEATFAGSFTDATFAGDTKGVAEAHVLHLDDLDLNKRRLWPNGYTVCPDPADPTRGTTRGVTQQLPYADPGLAGCGELGPVLGHRRIDVELTAIGEEERAQRVHCLG
jgi:hypothetical protein